MKLRLAALAVLAAASAGCVATRDFHGYAADQALPEDIQPTIDTRATVLQRLGSPSTTALFNENLWVYMSSEREMLAFYYPKVVSRKVVAIQFDADDTVSDVLLYDIRAGRTIKYNSRVTPTRGRELGILEQLFGTLGRLPQSLPGSERQRQPGEGR